MSSNAITIPGVQIDEKPWVDTLHEWVTTVDHKRLGVLYILYALLFLVIAGVEALIIRIQLMFPHNHFVSPGSSTACSPCMAQPWFSSWACQSCLALQTILCH